MVSLNSCKKNSRRTGVFYAKKIAFKTEGKTKMFPDRQKQGECGLRRTTLEEILKGFSGKRMNSGGRLAGQGGVKNNKAANTQENRSLTLKV